MERIKVAHFSEVNPDDWPWSNFPPWEVADRETGELIIPVAFMNKLQTMRELCGFALPLNSGFRTPEHDTRIGGKGVHPEGAFDIKVAGEKAFYATKHAFTVGFQGLGFHQRGPWSKRFIHVDDIVSDKHPRPRIWTYKR